MTGPRLQQGFTMIEVLVSILVLAIGLLGMAALQTTALRNSQEAYVKSQATILAYEIADKIRANWNVTPASAAQDTNCTSTTGCTEQAMANNDLFEWAKKIATYLPGGSGWVCRDSSPNDGSSGASVDSSNTVTGANGTNAGCNSTNPNDPIVIKIWWDQDRNGSVAASEKFVTEFKI